VRFSSISKASSGSKKPLCSCGSSGTYFCQPSEILRGYRRRSGSNKIRKRKKRKLKPSDSRKKGSGPGLSLTGSVIRIDLAMIADIHLTDGIDVAALAHQSRKDDAVLDPPKTEFLALKEDAELPHLRRRQKRLRSKRSDNPDAAERLPPHQRKRSRSLREWSAGNERPLRPLLEVRKGRRVLPHYRKDPIAEEERDRFLQLEIHEDIVDKNSPF
jgi:hypothetical protein